MPGKRGRLSLDQRAALPLASENPGIEYLRLNRREICWTEVNAAVRLFLVDEDPISAHLLASAAVEIMVALSDGRPGIGLNDMRAMLKSLGISRDLTEKTFQGLLHPYNFLKHSSADSTVTNEFSVEYIVMTIYSAVNSYRIMFDSVSAEMTVFSGIVQTWRLHWWEGSPGFEEKQRIARQLPFTREASREEICEFGREMLRKARRAMSL